MDCARSVVELLTRYWPYSIDVLQPEGAITDGVQPIFFTGQENVRLPSAIVNELLGPKFVNRLIWRNRLLGTVKGESLSSGQTNV